MTFLGYILGAILGSVAAALIVVTTAWIYSGTEDEFLHSTTGAIAYVIAFAVAFSGAIAGAILMARATRPPTLRLEVPPAAIAELATRLGDGGETRLAQRLRVAVDRRAEFRISSDDHKTVAGVLARDPIPGLESLHETRERGPVILQSHGNTT